MTPNDPPFANPPWGNQDYLKQIGMPAAWAIEHNASTQVIAIVDSGVDATNPDLAGAVLPGHDFVGTGNGETDPYGSGTTEAGIAAADTNNGIGIAGVAWGAKILPVRVFDSNGYATPTTVAAGINWAATHGATVINLSLWSGVDDPGIHAAVENAIAHGIPVVAAAGDEFHTSLPYPAADPGVISVNADAPNQHIANFSPMGAGMDLSAPGVQIMGLASSQAPPQAGSYNNTTTGDGSTLAAPIVSGIVALMRAHDPALSPAQINQRLRTSAVDLGPVGVDPYHGWGQVNAAAALAGTVGPPPPAAIPETFGPNNVPALATTIGTAASDLIAVEGDVHWYRYHSSGGRLTVTVAPAYDQRDGESIDPVVDVYNSSLQQIGHEDIQGIDQPETAHVIVSPGWMYIEVHNANGSADVNPYQITIATDPENGSYYGDSQYYPLGAPGVALAIGDVTGSGRPSVVVATTSYGYPGSVWDNRLWVFPEQADGSLGTPTSYSTDLTAVDDPPTTLAIGDFNGDGRKDVAMMTDSGVEVFMQNASGQLVANGIIPGSARNAGLGSGDLWGDGRDELITGSNALTVLTFGSSGWTQTVVSPTFVGSQIKVGEVDGDSLPEIVTTDLTKLHVFAQGAGGTWTDTQPALSGNPAGGLVLADLDGDGRTDIAVSEGGASDIFLQNASGQLVRQSEALIGGTGLSAGDVNGDGGTDLAVCCVATTLRVNGYYLPGNSGVTKMGDPDPSTSNAAFTLADINADGKADAIWASYYDGLVVADSNAGTTPTKPGHLPWIDSVTPINGTTTTSVEDPAITFGRPVAATAITGAHVQLVDTTTGVPVSASLSFSSAANTVWIHPLHPLTGGKPYRVLVQNLVAADGSTMTDPFMSTLIEPGPPSVPLRLHLGNGAIGGALTTVATWSAPRFAMPAVTSYEVRIQSKSPSGVYSKYRYVTLTGTRLNIGGTRGYRYRVEVLARNSQGAGPWTSWSNWALPR